MELQFVTIEVNEGVALVTLNHPPVNALSPKVVDELEAAFKTIEADPQVRAVVLTGHGPKIFVAGADIKAMMGMNSAQAEELALTGQAALNRLQNMPKLSICAINGMALGGGLELAMACDIRLCAEHATLGQPEINLGIIPGFGGTQRLTRFVGIARAKEMLLTGDPINAQTALEWGLVNHVLPADQVLPKAMEIAHKVAAKAPVAQQLIHDAVERGIEMPLANALRVEADNFRKVFETEDKNEGIRAFVEKRAPQFQGK